MAAKRLLAKTSALLFSMASKRKTQAPKPAITLTEPYRMATKFTAEALIPVEALDIRWRQLRPQNSLDFELLKSALFVTSDMKYVRIKIISAYNNSDNEFNEELELYCQEFYNIGFIQTVSIWKSRFSRLSNYWMLISLVEA